MIFIFFIFVTFLDSLFLMSWCFCFIFSVDNSSSGFVDSIRLSFTFLFHYDFLFKFWDHLFWTQLVYDVFV